MNIALITPFGKTSSGSRIFLKYAEYMAEKGNHVTLIFANKESVLNSINDNVTIIFCPKWLTIGLNRGAFSLGEMIYKTIKLLINDFDCIHVCLGHRPSNLVPVIFAKYLKKSVIIEEWWEWYGKNGHAQFRKGLLGSIVAIYDTIFEVRTKYLFDGVIAISTTLKRRINAHTNVLVLNGGAEIDSLTAYNINAARDKLGIDRKNILIGMSGLGLNDHEDNLPFYKAFLQLVKNIPEIKLLVTGDSKYIQNVVQKIIPNDALINIGWVDFDTYNLYLSSCNAFVLPFPDTNRNRGRWPNKIGDFLTIGRPVITNPVGDIRMLFDKYKIGYMCSNSTNDYINAIKEVLEDKNTDWQSREVAELISIESRIDHIFELYNNLLMKKN